MAANHLYPTLPSPTASSVILSSDEEDEDIIVDDDEHPSLIHEPDHATTQGFCHTTVSLNEFEKSLTDRQKSSNYRAFSNSHKSPPNYTKDLYSYMTLAWSLVYKWRYPFIGLLLAFITLMYLGDIDQHSKRDYTLLCLSNKGTSKRDEPCLTQKELDYILPLAKEFRQLLHVKAGQAECDPSISKSITVKESLSVLSSQHHNVQINLADMKKMFYLFIYNPHWKINVLNSNEVPITDYKLDLTNNDVFVSLQPQRSLICRLKKTLQTFWNKLKLLTFIIICLLLLAAIILWFMKRRNDEQKQVYLLVDAIIDVLRAHYYKSIAHDKILPYVAIIHVRDMIIPPSERVKKQKVWDKAVEWLATRESRVRVETRMISGQQYEVWNWIQAEPPPTEEPDSSAIPPPVPSDSTAWPGRAFEDYPPDLANKVAPPIGTPSPCIRLKNMFQHTKHMPENEIRELENAVLERCGPKGAAVHIYVDKRSVHGCIYFKMDSLSSANAVYKVFHGSWFKGRLVTAKYIPESKYYKWFSVAQKSYKPLLPTYK